jgi:hypothetical protein
MDLAELAKDHPKVQIRMRSVDKDGNVSDMVSVEVVNKAREYDLQVKRNMYGDTEATFRCPKDREGLAAVLKSVIKYGKEKGLIEAERVEEIHSTLSELITED